MFSIKDVAKLANVSISTVSRVINNRDSINEKTKEIVSEAIKALDYKPNLIAKGLRVKSSNLIGLVIPIIDIDPFTEIISSTCKIANKNGFDVILGYCQNNPDMEEDFIVNLIRRHVDGIIFSRVSDESRVLRIINKTDVPVVVIDRMFEIEEIPSVILDNYKAGEIAAQHLNELGHEKIACVTGPLDITLCRERINGFQETLKRYGINIEASNIFEGNLKFESGKDAVKYFIKNNNKITALWAQNDLMALGILNELLFRGIKVPDDISLMGMDNFGISQMVRPSLTTISQPFYEMCDMAIKMILEQKEFKKVLNKKVVLEPELVIRESTKNKRRD